MKTAAEIMQITIIDRGMRLRDRLRDRLDSASRLLCPEHGAAVVAVTIHARENGWFDSQWITCCDTLEQQAAAIVKHRC
jgi:hypothetical protein